MTDNLVSPIDVLREVAGAMPDELRSNIIVVGSLAAAYGLLPREAKTQARTKDIDCVVCPRVEAVARGTRAAEDLLAKGWRPKKDGAFGEPGTDATPLDQLPGVRLFPPHSNEWWIEFLTVPEPTAEPGKGLVRVELSLGHYGIPYFEYTAVAVFDADMCEFGVRCAHPEMMVLANLLEHPRVRPDPIRGSNFRGHEVRRSNKDLGRVLAIASLSPEEAMESWPGRWIEALRSCFPGRWQALGKVAGAGLRELLADDEYMQEAAEVCNNGLLATRNVHWEELRRTGQQIIAYAIEPLEELSARSPR